MTRRQRFCFAAIAMMTVSLGMPAAPRAASDSEVPESCPVTRPSNPAFVPPAPYPKTPPDGPNTFWHGASGLWTRLAASGVHSGIPSPSPMLPGAISTRNKLFWWSPGFTPIGMPEPPLKIEARRLDGEAPAFKQPWVTNAHVPEWGGWTMLTMLDLPTVGCWEVTGTYGADFVTFVVWVDTPKPEALKPHFVPGPRGSGSR